ncbi:MAG: LicD family protein [Defluviitaleaceae bacterium]|nr:LicD family protein [Defluviitaleaceae bacterium]
MDETKNAQERSYTALQIVDKLCRENDIRYFLLAGTVLGAVRHGGFIPWDDDIDIGMLPADYDKFTTICQKALPENYFWSTPDTNLLHSRFFGKIVSDGKHCLDVFPVFKTADSMFLRKVQWYQIKMLYVGLSYRLGELSEHKRTSLKQVCIAICAWLAGRLSRNTIIKLMHCVSRRYENAETSTYINLFSRYKMHTESIKAEWLQELVPIKFENADFPAFKNTHDYLEHMYGNYMKLPPKSKRVGDHANVDIRVERVDVGE